MQQQLQELEPHKLMVAHPHKPTAPLHLEHPINDCIKALAETSAEVCCQSPQPPPSWQYRPKHAACCIVPSSCNSRGWVGSGGKAVIHTAVCLHNKHSGVRSEKLQYGDMQMQAACNRLSLTTGYPTE
jgi:hypothetical protein